MYQPLRPARRKPGESYESFEWAQRIREEMNRTGRIGYLEGLVEALRERLKWQEQISGELRERIARLEAQI